MNICELPHRGVIQVSGEDARSFLQGLVTADMDALSEGSAKFGALLTPQGKILFDFFIADDGDRYLIDTLKAHRADLAKRLGFYKLRAKVDIADLTDTHMVMAFWGDGGMPDVDGRLYTDPRLDGLGHRAIVKRSGFAAPSDCRKVDMVARRAFRIGMAVPEAGLDYEYGDVFPHDVDMDALNGIDFEKGCYVGQEVVSRMQHRSTARRRIVGVRAAAQLPPPGTQVMAGDKPVGSLGSNAGTSGLAMIRLDRAKIAIDTGISIVADTIEITLTIPDWATFDWPKTTEETI